MIHYGRGIFVTLHRYNMALTAGIKPDKKGDYQLLIKTLGETVFTREELENSSVSGKSSNRNKEADPRPALDPTKLLALQGNKTFLRPN